jgi:hypothetical protein
MLCVEENFLDFILTEEEIILVAILINSVDFSKTNKLRDMCPEQIFSPYASGSNPSKIWFFSVKHWCTIQFGIHKQFQLQVWDYCYS